MQLMIRNNTAAPIYQQIYQQIKEQIINGTLEEDTMLPSIRSLAKELRISIITTKRAYEELERDGFVYTIAGKGVFVARKIQKSCGKSGCDRLNRTWKQLQHWQRAADFPKRTYRKC